MTLVRVSHCNIMLLRLSQLVESRMGAVAWAFGHRPVSHPTGSPEAVARLRFPQNVACGFPALRSSAGDLQHCKSLQLRVREAQLWFQ